MLTPLLDCRRPTATSSISPERVALARQHRAREAFDALTRCSARWRRIRSSIRAAERVVRAELASSAEPRVSMYSDSDRLVVQRFAPAVTLALSSGTRISVAGYERTQARGGGRKRSRTARRLVDGAGRTGECRRWRRSLGRVSFGGQLGQARVDGQDRSDLRGRDPGPAARHACSLPAERTEGLFVVSPRTVGLGMTQVAHQAPGRVDAGDAVPRRGRRDPSDNCRTATSDSR